MILNVNVPVFINLVYDDISSFSGCLDHEDQLHVHDAKSSCFL